MSHTTVGRRLRALEERVPKSEVLRLAAIMCAVPARFVRDNARALRGIAVHGSFFSVDSSEDTALEADFPELAAGVDGVGKDAPDATLESLKRTFDDAKGLVVRAAEGADALLLVLR